VWHSLWNTFAGDFGQILGQLKKHMTLVDNEAHLVYIESNQVANRANSQALHDMANESLNFQHKFLAEHKSAHEMLSTLQLREVIQWLSAVIPLTDYDKARSRVHPLTGAWFLDLKEFRGWLTAPKNQVYPMLWIHGAPG